METRYINSGDIHVFPCAYRTQKTDDTASPNNWDPEARLNTEKNFTNLATGLGKKSYLISWDGTENTKLCCVIGGYYFEIAGETLDSLKDKYLCIRKIDANIIGETKTKILGTFSSEEQTPPPTHLDIQVPEAGTTVYKFTGLVVSDEVVGTDYLQVVENNSIKYDEFLPNTITRGQNENTVVIGKYSAFANTDDVVIVANGTGAGTNRSNIAKITKTGIVDNGTLEVAGIATFKSNITASGTATFNNSVAINGTASFTDTIVADKEATFNEVINANKGLNVSNAALTVGGSACTIDTSGNISAAGTVTIANDLITTSSDASVTLAGSVFANNGLNINNANLTINTNKFTVNTNGDITTAGSSIVLSNLPSTGTDQTAPLQINISGKVTWRDLTVADPTASGASLSFIDTISQNPDGKIVPTKKNITIETGASQGQIKINGSNYDIKNLTSGSAVNFGAATLTVLENGSNVSAYGSYSHAEGFDTSASGQYSHAEGIYTIASGHYSHAEGYGMDLSHPTLAVGLGAHAEGYRTTAIGEAAHAEGDQTNAYGNRSHAEGFNTATGKQTDSSSGLCAHAEGYKTIAIGSYSHAEGSSTLANGNWSHAEGCGTYAAANGAHAEGIGSGGAMQTNYGAKGDYSHAEGYWTLVEAAGSYGHAEGEGTKVSHKAAHASGCYTKTSAQYQTVVGQYNADNANAIFIVGYGTSNNYRKNVLEVTASGITVTGETTSTTFNTNSDKRLKENIIDYAPKNSILDLPIKQFDFIDGPKQEIGCIAQDLQELFPELVKENDEGYLSIKETKLIYLLIAEVKKLKERLDKVEKNS